MIWQGEPLIGRGMVVSALCEYIVPVACVMGTVRPLKGRHSRAERSWGVEGQLLWQDLAGEGKRKIKHDGFLGQV